MPTIPPGRAPLPGSESPGRHRVARSFGADAERYDRARPRYPDALVQRIVAAAPGPDVLDVGCGTGIAARQFQALGCRVLGVEPDARMADLARRLGGEIDVATFEDWDPGGREFDAVVAGQAWHWIDPVAGAAKAARVLRPGGVLALFWNVFGFPPDVADAVVDVCRRVMPDAPFDIEAMTKEPLDAYRVMSGKVADGIRAGDGFGEPEQWRYDWEWTYSRDMWLDQMPTLGAFTQLPPDTMAKVSEGVGAAIDVLGGSFPMRYTTMAVTTTRPAARPGM
ncbi:class I SAM-dependent methyltransferase [Embleya scabrispora]|uniref:class I SAM-dependent methyltransferase n=1 Tax=Embleya scabrispora TaxID=159449 RepID=UPI00047699D9|nr:class I SAM-dependent methyltransferase [Embleya scabrispora]MYS86006.1 methyltransferase domain-containing protein [Streptomyces sp. SID5474]